MTGLRFPPCLGHAFVSLTTIALVGACSTPGAAPGTGRAVAPQLPTEAGWETAAIATLGATPEPVPVTIGLPYKPDVQFAPLYVALEKGHFAAQQLAPELQYGDESTLLRLVATRKLVASVASGEQVILARAEGIPVTYVMTWFARYPGAVFTLDPDVQTVADLVGRKVGLPSLQGTSYTGWQALLAQAGIDPRRIPTEVIGYRQLDAVLQGQVDAAVGYATNEPVQMRQMGHQPTVIEIADHLNLVSNGLVVAQSLIDESPDVVQGLVTGFLEGLEATIADPEAAFATVTRFVPEAGDAKVHAAQRQVLAESIRFWRSDRLGAVDPPRWQESQAFMRSIGLIQREAPVAEMLDGQFVDAYWSRR